MNRSACFAGLLLASLAWVASGARAAGLQVAPVLLEFGVAETAQVVRLSNSSDAPLRAQVRVLAWTQPGGADQLQPTRDLVASPPIMEVAPGRDQLVRIIRLRPAASAGEEAYRLLIDELPAESSAARQGVQLLLRHSVPLFVLPPGAIPALEKRGKGESADLEVQARPAAEAVLLSVRNKGSQRVRLTQVSFEGSDGQSAPVEPGLLGYVLAGQQMQWTVRLPPARLASGGTFKARLNDDTEPKALAPAVAPR
ncbi:MAG: molecular chaperone [Comamonadaceae bacterium]|nr:MAG: molecular chaperone [Comamonadaceae bacterium]